MKDMKELKAKMKYLEEEIVNKEEAAVQQKENDASLILNLTSKLERAVTALDSRWDWEESSSSGGGGGGIPTDKNKQEYATPTKARRTTPQKAASPTPLGAFKQLESLAAERDLVMEEREMAYETIATLQCQLEKASVALESRWKWEEEEGDAANTGGLKDVTSMDGSESARYTAEGPQAGDLRKLQQEVNELRLQVQELKVSLEESEEDTKRALDGKERAENVASACKMEVSSKSMEIAKLESEVENLRHLSSGAVGVSLRSPVRVLDASPNASPVKLRHPSPRKEEKRLHGDTSMLQNALDATKLQLKRTLAELERVKAESVIQMKKLRYVPEIDRKESMDIDPRVSDARRAVIDYRKKAILTRHREGS